MTAAGNGVIPYQVIIQGQLIEDKPGPSYTADTDPKVQKDMKPPMKKHMQSKDAFLAFKLGSAVLAHGIAPLSFSFGCVLGALKPIADYHFKNVIPKSIQAETDVKEFGSLGATNQIYYAIFGMGVPLFTASALSRSHPFVSSSLIIYSGYALAEELSQRLVRWIAPPQ